MSEVLIIDDHLLLRVLLDDEPRALRPGGATLTTTGLWYHRLCRALSNQDVIGSMSRRLGQVDIDVAAGVIEQVIDLPATIQLLSLRTLGWRMGTIVNSGTRLNLLSLEALAAAHELDAEICMSESNENAPLAAAARHVGIVVRLVTE